MSYVVSPGGASMVDVRRYNFVIWFSRTRENAFLNAFSKNFVFCHTFILLSKSGGAMAHPAPLAAWVLLCFLNMSGWYIVRRTIFISLSEYKTILSLIASLCEASVENYLIRGSQKKFLIHCISGYTQRGSPVNPF